MAAWLLVLLMSSVAYSQIMKECPLNCQHNTVCVLSPQHIASKSAMTSTVASDDANADSQWMCNCPSHLSGVLCENVREERSLAEDTPTWSPSTTWYPTITGWPTATYEPSLATENPNYKKATEAPSTWAPTTTWYPTITAWPSITGEPTLAIENPNYKKATEAPSTWAPTTTWYPTITAWPSITGEPTLATDNPNYKKATQAPSTWAPTATWYPTVTAWPTATAEPSLVKENPSFENPTPKILPPVHPPRDFIEPRLPVDAEARGGVGLFGKFAITSVFIGLAGYAVLRFRKRRVRRDLNYEFEMSSNRPNNIASGHLSITAEML